jgi:hypothetical protein
MLSSVPTNTRVLAHSTRGYKGSSPFSASDSSPEQLRARIGHDLASIVAAYIHKLFLLSNPGSKVKLLTWSIGVCSLLSAYNLLAEGKLEHVHEEALSEQISQIIIFEGPSELGFGMPASASTLAFRSSVGTLTPGAMFVAAIRRATGIYDYPQEVLDDVVKGIPTTHVDFQPRSSLADDDAFMAIITPIMEPGPLSYYVQARTQESDEGVDYSRTALRAMLKAPAVTRINVLTTKHTVPDCFAGPAVLVGELARLEEEIQVKKMSLRFVEGEYNHFVLVQAPDVLWKAIES